jgi:hypothetical protein
MAAGGEMGYRSGAVPESFTRVGDELGLCRPLSWDGEPLLEDFQAAVGNWTQDADCDRRCTERWTGLAV